MMRKAPREATLLFYAIETNIYTFLIEAAVKG